MAQVLDHAQLPCSADDFPQHMLAAAFTQLVQKQEAAGWLLHLQETRYAAPSDALALHQPLLHCLLLDMAEALTQGVQKVTFFPPDPEVMIAGHKENILEFLDDNLKGVSQNGLVI